MAMLSSIKTKSLVTERELASVNEMEKRNKKGAVHSYPSTPMQDVNRGGVAPWVMCGPRGAEQGVAACTHAGPWLDSNFFVTLPTVIVDKFLTGDNINRTIAIHDLIFSLAERRRRFTHGRAL